MKQQSIGIFSFFTGAGFLDLGFETSGFTSLAANEIDLSFARVYRHSREKMSLGLPKFGLQEESVANFLEQPNRRNWLSERITEAKRFFQLVGFVGGPPCPDFSVAGKQAGATGKHGHLSQTYMDMICLFLPDFFVFENVKGLLKTAKHREFFEKLVQQAHRAGYATAWRLLNSLRFGVPQVRERVIFVGVRKCLLKKGYVSADGQLQGVPWEEHMHWSEEDLKRIPWPERNRFEENGFLPMPAGVPEELTVEHWFRKNAVETHPNAGDYFKPRAGLDKMRHFEEGDDSKKCYKRLHRWRYSPTAAYGNNEVHLHPYKARRLSVAETLAIQSLPREYELPADISLSSKFKTIGNGVPFLLAQGVAETLRDFLGKAVRR